MVVREEWVVGPSMRLVLGAEEGRASPAKLGVIGRNMATPPPTPDAVIAGLVCGDEARPIKEWAWPTPDEWVWPFEDGCLWDDGWCLREEAKPPWGVLEPLATEE